jgi:hypothetical protein
MERKEQEAIEKRMRMLWIIWASMLVFLAMHVVVCYYLADNLHARSSQAVPLEMAKNIFYGLTVVSLLLAYLLRKFQLRVTIDRSSQRLINVRHVCHHLPSRAPLFQCRFWFSRFFGKAFMARTNEC